MIEELINLCTKYFTEEEIELIKKAYNYADKAHYGQKRQSGEPYIIHPVRVAYYVLTKYHLYDANAVCAALLHDTIEDTNTTFEDLVREFNFDIASLVLNVTNSSTVSFKDKNEKEVYNNAMVLRNMLSDIRTIIIKSSDRFHNMETLEYKEPDHRARKSAQTFCFYVPLDYAIGANTPARELEDLCFKYMHPESYTHTLKIKQNFEKDNGDRLGKMISKLYNLLLASGISFSLNAYIKSLYNLHKKLNKYHRLSKIPGLLTAQIVVDTKEDCYKVLEILRGVYDCFDVKDDLVTTDLDGYQGIILTIKGFKNYKLRVEIFTREMELFNSFGYATILNSLKGKSISDVHEIIKSKSNFFSNLNEIGEYYDDNADLISHAEEELLGSKIKIVTNKGEIIKLPKGSTVLDFAYFIHSDIGATAYGAIVNGEFVDVNYVLKSNDRVTVKCDKRVVRNLEDASTVRTTRARRRILEKLSS